MKRAVFIAAVGLTVLTAGQMELASSQSLGGITLTMVTPRIMTPNGDLRNDVVLFRFDDTLSGLPVESAVYDVNGAKVSGLRLNSSDETQLLWDGRDDNGNAMPSGIYVYSIEIGKKRATGTVVVAR
jgi:flagellar hook assembly protein FlgD